jgi:SecD/SecF fusion protein
MNRRNLVWLIVAAFAIWPIVVKLTTDRWPTPENSLDFAGGVRLLYEMDQQDAIVKGLTTDGQKQQALQQTKDTFLFRLRDFDLSELSVRTIGNTSLVVEAPGTEQIDAVLDKVGHAQVISFRILDDDASSEPNGCFHFRRDRQCQRVGRPVLEHKDFVYWNTRSQQDTDKPGSYVVVLRVAQQSLEKWKSVTKQYYHQRLAICLDEEITTAPVIEAEDIGADAEITGYQTASNAQDIANLLKAGPLVVSFNLVDQKIVSPTLGAASFHRARILIPAAVAAISLLLFLAYSNRKHLVYMIFVCQLVQASAIYLLAWRGYLTLNLLSVCALVILSGVSVDGLILICEEFERQMREEKGLTPRTTSQILTLALAKERWIIVAANLMSLTTVMPLYFLKGGVQSLVVTMAVGTLLAVLTTLMLAPNILRSDWIMDGIRRASRVAPHLKLRFNLFAMNKTFLTIYLTAFLASLVLIATTGFLKGIDFVSGAEITITSDRGLDMDLLTSKANEFLGRRCSVRHLSSGGFEPGGPQTYVFQVPGAELQLNTATAFVQSLQSVVPGSLRLAGVSSLGAAVTGMTRQSTIYVMMAGLGLLAILLLWQYQPIVAAAIWLALIGDTVITVGSISLFNIPLSLPIVSALLTVAGYSVYDSIVVARHVSMDVRALGHNDEQFNRCLESLSRRLILTVTTTALAALMIAIFCQDLLRDFGIVMTTGAVFGMMSTAAIVVRGLKSVNSGVSTRAVPRAIATTGS